MAEYIGMRDSRFSRKAGLAGAFSCGLSSSIITITLAPFSSFHLVLRPITFTKNLTFYQLLRTQQNIFSFLEFHSPTFTGFLHLPFLELWQNDIVDLKISNWSLEHHLKANGVKFISHFLSNSIASACYDQRLRVIR